MNAPNGSHRPKEMSSSSTPNQSNSHSNRSSRPNQQTQPPHRSLVQQTPGAPPYAVPIIDPFTRSHQLVPGSEFPSISPQDQLRVKGWMEKDTVYLQNVQRHQPRVYEEYSKVDERLLKGQDWLGTNGPPASLSMRTEAMRLAARGKGKIGTARKELKLSKIQLKEIALQREVLIPIRVEFEQDSYKLRDTFTWNLTETILTPELFATYLCEDLRLPGNIFHREIVTQIRRQLTDAQPMLNYDAHLTNPGKEIKAENRDWFENRAKRRKLNMVEDSTMEDESSYQVKTEAVEINEELRVVIKLDITLDSIQLLDRFEWDISDSSNSPETFAEVFANDLGLGGEFKTAIAHAIREQIEVFVKSLCLLEHVSGLAVGDDDLSREFLPHLLQPFRADAAEFTPVILQLSAEEVDRNEKERDRDARRKRRQTKGRGITLPDREPIKTHRTLVPIPSGPALLPTQNDNGDTVYGQAPIVLPYPIISGPLPPKPPTIEDFAPINQNQPIIGNQNNFDRSRKNLKNQSMDRSGSQLNSGFERKRTKVDPELMEEVGPRENIIAGRWHCSNCGMPEHLTPSKRKGPFGEETNCNLCGKHFSRNRRNRAVLYSLDIDYHTQLQARIDRGEVFKEISRSAVRPAAPPIRVIKQKSKEESSAESEDEAQASDSSSTSAASSVKSKQTRTPTARGAPRNRNAVASPDLPLVQFGSSESGKSDKAASPRQPPPVSVPVARKAAKPNALSYQPPAQQPPPWMRAATISLGAAQTDDRFEIIPRTKLGDVTEWKIRCLDCPGKLYNLGPGETLDNFSVHFKNRVHRENVTARLSSTVIAV